jgi:hypothetical protein
MSTFPAMLLLVVCTAAPAATLAQATNSSSSITPTVDPQSLTILQASLKAMGGSVPSDSEAAGAVTTVGGQTDQGTIRSLTKSSGETSVEMAMPDATRTTVYANGQASESVGGVLTPLPLELAVTSQAPEFPLIAALLNDPDTSLRRSGSLGKPITVPY